MTSPSPTCTVNATPTTNGVDVSASSTVSIALVDSTGVSSWSITCTSTDDLNTTSAVNATLSVDNVNFTASYTQPFTSTGSAVQFTSAVNGGVDSNGVSQPSYSTTFGVFVLDTLGTRLFFPNETYESSAQYGVVKDLNAIGRASVSVPVATTTTAGAIKLANDLSGTYDSPDVVQLTGSGGAVNVPIAHLAFGGSPASTGTIRLSNANNIVWRNAANTHDNTLSESANTLAYAVSGSTIASFSDVAATISSGEVNLQSDDIITNTCNGVDSLVVSGSGCVVGPSDGSGSNSILGSIHLTTRSVSSSFTVDTGSTDMLIFADTTGGAFTITLPASATAGRWICIIDQKNTFAASNCTIGRNGNLINNAASDIVLSSNGQRVWIVSDGTNWFSLNKSTTY